MYNTNMNDLLNVLTETTTKCDSLISLTESIDKPYIGTIQKRLFGLQNILMDSLQNSHPAYMTQDTIELIKKVRTINPTDAHRVLTYPNIHKEKSYDIKAGVMIGYVLNKLDSLLKEGKDIDSSKILREGVAYSYKKLTGENVGRELDIGEFREKYRLYALGGFNRVQVYPRINTLIKLAIQSPKTLNYIDDHLIYRHIRSLKDYANELNSRFSEIVRRDPKMKNKLNKYISCVESAIKYVNRMYRDIRVVHTELDVEYRRIFREIISIDNSLKSRSLNEVTQLDPVISNLSIIYEQINKLDDITLTESIENQNEKESLLKSLKESLLETNRYFLSTNINKLNEREQIRNEIRNSACLVSKLTQDICDNNPVSTYPNINHLLTANIQNILTQQMIDRVNDIEKFPEARGLVKKILNNVEIFKDCYCGDDKSPWLGDTLDNIHLAITGGYNNEYVTLNVESLANNLITIPNVLEQINESMLLLYKSISDKISEITKKLKNENCVELKDNIMKIVNYYCVHNEILDRIYRSLEMMALESISNIQKINLRGEF